MIKVIQSLPNTGKSTCMNLIKESNVLDLLLFDTDDLSKGYDSKTDLDTVIKDIYELNGNMESLNINKKNVIIFTNLHLLENNILNGNIDIYKDNASEKFDVEYIICIPDISHEFRKKFFCIKGKDFSSEMLYNWYLDYLNKYCFCNYTNKFNKYILSEHLSNCFPDFIFGGKYVK